MKKAIKRKNKFLLKSTQRIEKDDLQLIKEAINKIEEVLDIKRTVFSDTGENQND